MEQQTYYRIKDVHTQDGVTAYLERWTVEKTTPRGAWVKHMYAPHYYDFKQLKNHKYLKFILNNARKKYCYPIIEEAVASFKLRKHRQLGFIKIQLEQVQTCVDDLEKLEGVTVDSFKDYDGVVLGVMPSHSLFNFDY